MFPHDNPSQSFWAKADEQNREFQRRCGDDDQAWNRQQNCTNRNRQHEHVAPESPKADTRRPEIITYHCESLPGDLRPFEKIPSFTLHRGFDGGYKIFNIHSGAEMIWFDAPSNTWHQSGRDSMRELELSNGGRILTSAWYRKIRLSGISGQFVGLVSKHDSSDRYQVEGVNVTCDKSSGDIRVTFDHVKFFYGYPNAADAKYAEPSTIHLSSLGMTKKDMKVLAVVNLVTDRPLYIAPGFYLNRDAPRDWTLEIPPGQRDWACREIRDGTREQVFDL